MGNAQSSVVHLVGLAGAHLVALDTVGHARQGCSR